MACVEGCVCVTEEMAVCEGGCPGGVWGEGHVCWSEGERETGGGVIGVDV